MSRPYNADWEVLKVQKGTRARFAVHLHNHSTFSNEFWLVDDLSHWRYFEKPHGAEIDPELGKVKIGATKFRIGQRVINTTPYRSWYRDRIEFIRVEKDRDWYIMENGAFMVDSELKAEG